MWTVYNYRIIKSQSLSLSSARPFVKICPTILLYCCNTTAVLLIFKTNNQSPVLKIKKAGLWPKMVTCTYSNSAFSLLRLGIRNLRWRQNYTAVIFDIPKALYCNWYTVEAKDELKHWHSWQIIYRDCGLWIGYIFTDCKYE